MEKKLTVTIVTFFTDFLVLNEAIKSIKNDFDSAYFVIVDNSQSDGYFRELKKFLFEYQNIVIINTTSNKGYGAGHNYAEKHCPESIYHLIVNPDIRVHKGSLKAMIEYMEKEKSISILFPKILNSDESLQYLNTREPSLLDLMINRFPLKFFKNLHFLKKREEYFRMKDIGYDSNYDLQFLSGCFMLFRRKAYALVNGFDENYFMYFEDWDICKKITSKGLRISYLHSSKVTHYYERGSTKKIKLFISLIVSMIRYFGKWGWKLW